MKIHWPWSLSTFFSTSLWAPPSLQLFVTLKSRSHEQVPCTPSLHCVAIHLLSTTTQHTSLTGSLYIPNTFFLFYCMICLRVVAMVSGWGGIWNIGGFCNRVVSAWGGSVTNKAILSSFETSHFYTNCYTRLENLVWSHFVFI